MQALLPAELKKNSSDNKDCTGVRTPDTDIPDVIVIKLYQLSYTCLVERILSLSYRNRTCGLYTSNAAGTYPRKVFLFTEPTEPNFCAAYTPVPLEG